eukprot:TRINITY_DN10446_c0_g2_i11.p1 TRINITY_DN10446_c0_g2~~TRINITY_DN10446_c0_g2_i11.p1  ORF type:complete len:112 (-),score=33.13 TRINITY_DN10446_c0_g2_i11:106-441(-)
MNKQYYVFDANATVTNLTSFVKRKYKAAKANKIGAPKTLTQKMFAIAKFNLADFLVTFDNLGFNYLPPLIKKPMLAFFLLLPIILPLLCLYYTKEEPVKEVKRAKEKLKAE